MKIAVVPGLLRLVVVAALLAGCSGNPDKERPDRPENPFKTARSGPGGSKSPLSEKELRLAASELYKRAHQALDDSDFSTAVERYSQLIARYPFSAYSTQAEMEKIYAQYRNFQSDEAVTAADRFLREHPRNPSADYVQYVKGLTNASRDETFSDFLPIDTAKKDVTNERRAYDDFALLVQRYPNSRYAGDARRRMVYLRNRVADHDLSIVRFYVKRGAYVAAAKRAESIVAEYPGAPATAEALKLLESSDRKIGLTREADEVAALIAANPATFAAAAAKPPKVKKVIPTLAAGDARVVPVIGSAPEPTPAPAAVVDAPPPHRSFMQRFVSMFDFLDTSKPENSYTVIVPTGNAASSSASTAGATTAAAATTASAAAPTVARNSNAESAYGSPTPAASGSSTRLHASVDYGDATDSTEKTTSAAPSAGTPVVATAAPASTEPAKSDTAAATPVKSRGFLERFVDFFSFLDPNRNGSESSAPPPSTTKIDNTGDKVPAATPDK